MRWGRNNEIYRSGGGRKREWINFSQNVWSLQLTTDFRVNIQQEIILSNQLYQNLRIVLNC